MCSCISRTFIEANTRYISVAEAAKLHPQFVGGSIRVRNGRRDGGRTPDSTGTGALGKDSRGAS